MAAYEPNRSNPSSESLDSGSSGLGATSKSSGDAFELISDLVEYLDGDIGRMKGSVASVAQEIGGRADLVGLLVESYTPDQLRSDVDRLKGDMTSLLTDVVDDVVGNGVDAIKRVGDAVWEAATSETHKLIISTITQALTAPPQLALGSVSSIPKLIKIVRKAQQLANLASLLDAVSKVTSLFSQMASVISDIQRMVDDVRRLIDGLDDLAAGAAGGRIASLSQLQSLQASLRDVNERNGAIETASQPFPEPEGTVA